MSLRHSLLDYDGRSTATLEVAADRYRHDRAAIDQCVELLDSPDGHTSTGASWLLKRWLEEGVTLSDDQIRAIADRLDELGSHWAALHLCQSIRFLEISDEFTPAFRTFLERCNSSERPFLRAWSMDGLVRLAASRPDIEDLARERLQAAMSDGAASVRARARRLLAEMSRDA